ncbi:MAG: hypothetical protein JWP11_3686 [Frankiales bacterium]|nr:hypothetical protein [Frankiales bacterium]
MTGQGRSRLPWWWYRIPLAVGSAAVGLALGRYL